MQSPEKKHSHETSFSRRNLIGKGARGACLFCAAGLGLALLPGKAEAQTAKLGFMRPKKSPWFSSSGGTAVVCELCPKGCRIESGDRGACGVRENRGGEGYTLSYGNPCLVQIDPVERKPFFHVRPGARALSVSTAGCPLECKFCEVWDMALVDPEEVHGYDLTPEDIVRHASAAGVEAVSYAFGEPVAFYEYMVDICDAASPAGLLKLMHSSGYFAPKPLENLIGKIDAVNIDLKSFDPRFYREMTGGELDPVLEALKRFRAGEIHIEITNLVIPTLNDDPGEIRRMARWIREELGADTPLHFARFYPLYKLTNLPPTPVSALDQARNAAMEEGLRFVYIAKVPGHEGENTYCPECGEKVIDRMGFVIEDIRMDGGRCGRCGAGIAGLWR